MRIAMPSPKGTNHENLFLTGRVAELVARQNPVGTYRFETRSAARLRPGRHTTVAGAGRHL